MSSPLIVFFALLVFLLSFIRGFSVDQALMVSSLATTQRSTQAFLNYAEAVRCAFLHAGRQLVAPYPLSHASVCGGGTFPVCTGREEAFADVGVHLFDMGFQTGTGPFFPGFAVDGDGVPLAPDTWRTQPIGSGFSGDEVLNYGLSNVLDTDPVHPTRYNLLIWGTNMPDGGRGVLKAYGKGAGMGFKMTGELCASAGSSSCVRSHNFPDVLFPISDGAARLVPDGTIVSIYKPIPDLPHE